MLSFREFVCPKSVDGAFLIAANPKCLITQVSGLKKIRSTRAYLNDSKYFFVFVLFFSTHKCSFNA